MAIEYEVYAKDIFLKWFCKLSKQTESSLQYASTMGKEVIHILARKYAITAKGLSPFNSLSRLDMVIRELLRKIMLLIKRRQH